MMRHSLTIAIIATIVFCCAGCTNYRTFYPPQTIYTKHIKEGTHTTHYFLTDGIDTIWTPKGNYWLTQKDIELYYREPRNQDEVVKKAILLHELLHMYDTHQLMNVWLGPKYEWYTEKRGYAVQIRYLIMKGQKFSQKDIDNYVKIMLEYDMAGEREIRDWVERVVDEAEKDYAN